ncbi:enoyl-CoA hydratase-related protein [Vibrio sp. TRT 21S02]|uniref:enoyl-CoA hydratase-related protein n=1 Tax=Vibrio sp. TRT 21S02 TaxID=3418507 RepID=UPI003CF4574A
MSTEQQKDPLCEVNDYGVATLTLNRVDKHNAFDDQLIAGLTNQLKQLQQLPNVRVLILRANGKHFSAGADLHWMKSMAQQSHEANLSDARALAHLMRTLDTFPHPTIALVHGCAYGGALGLICCCDIAIAEDRSRFCLSEVKLGLLPATIAPYVHRAIGNRHSRRYMLTAEAITAQTAKDIGLIHELVDVGTLDSALSPLIKHILKNSPAAITQAKLLCAKCYQQTIDNDLINHTSQLIADIRVSKHGQEGLDAFFSQRPASWVRTTGDDEDEHPTS